MKTRKEIICANIISPIHYMPELVPKNKLTVVIREPEKLSPNPRCFIIYGDKILREMTTEEARFILHREDIRILRYDGNMNLSIEEEILCDRYAVNKMGQPYLFKIQTAIMVMKRMLDNGDENDPTLLVRLDAMKELASEELPSGSPMNQWISSTNNIILDLKDSEILCSDNISDGYHTFGDLYHHRAMLFASICHMCPKDIAWKSLKHNDDTMFDGMFIVGVTTPRGEATYHYNIEPYWDQFHVREIDVAPEWDGHTPGEAIGRIYDMCKTF